jgi:hypothetical protein
VLVKWKRARGKAEKNKMIKRCSGCLAVRYHDRTCQNAYVIFIQRIYSLLNPCRLGPPSKQLRAEVKAAGGSDSMFEGL